MGENKINAVLQIIKSKIQKKTYANKEIKSNVLAIQLTMKYSVVMVRSGMFASSSITRLVRPGCVTDKYLVKGNTKNRYCVLYTEKKSFNICFLRCA